jgi:heterodisulfide reductase subunit C/nitrate reductase gamma subunit
MTRQLVFLFTIVLTLGIFTYTVIRIVRLFMLTQSGFPVNHFGKRFWVMVRVAIGQTKIFRKPVIGFFHALVFWGFCVVLFGSIEMIADGLTGRERSFESLGWFYDFMMAGGDLFGLLVLISILIFLARRLFFHIARFEGIEMKRSTHVDANIALSIILLLMVSLLGMNVSYILVRSGSGLAYSGLYPVSAWVSTLVPQGSVNTAAVFYEIFWWSHILLIFLFANILPYSKHFHVFMSVPNVFLTRLEPLGKLPHMESITREVKMMLYPGQQAQESDGPGPVPGRFGVRDIEDITWKNYFDSLSCTQCGRCTAVCPANLTGKKLSPRKVMMDIRARMKEKGPLMLKSGKDFTDKKSLLRDYLSEEELWACTLCNACAQECPININHPTVIVDIRRYLVMEEASAPGELKSVFSNIENNGAPWQYSPEDRLLWSKDLFVLNNQH